MQYVFLIVFFIASVVCMIMCTAGLVGMTGVVGLVIGAPLVAMAPMC